MYILPLDKIDLEDKQLVGDKALSLGLILKAKLPVPKGFVVTSQVYEDYLSSQGLDKQIKEQLQLLDFSSPENINQSSLLIQNLINNTPLPKAIAQQIMSAYENLEGAFKQTPVAIRSSLINLDIPSGQTSLFLNICGESSVIEFVKQSWTSLFSPKNLINHLNLLKFKIAVIVQEMIDAEISGLAHSLDIRDLNKQNLSIEAIYGFGEFLVQHYVKPDYYFIDKKSLKIIDKIVNKQTIALENYYDKTQEKSVPLAKQKQVKLDDKQIKTLAQYALKIDRLHLKPQTIEWALVKNKIYFLQTQDLNPDLICFEKIIKKPKELLSKTKSIVIDNLNLPIIAHGFGVCSGIATGKSLLVKHPDDHQFIDKDTIIYTQDFTVDLLPLLSKAKAILAENGSYGSPAAIIARQLSMPTILGIKNIISKIKTGQILTINGATGNVYFGKPDLSSKVLGFERNNQNFISKKDIQLPYLKSATQIFANLATGHNPTIYKHLNIDGLVYIKGEYILFDLGVHPKKFILENKQKHITDLLVDHLSKVCSSLENKPVYYCFSDLQSNLLRQLSFGKFYEEKENNPFMGFRGILRHLSNYQLLKLEIEAIQIVRQKYSNLHIVFPFSRSVLEFLEFFKLVQSLGLKPSSSLQFYNLALTPSNLILTPQYLSHNIEGLIIDLEQLSSFSLGVDAINPNLMNVYNQADPSIIWLLNHVIAYSHKNQAKVIVVGDILAKNINMVNNLVKAGIYGISVSPDLTHAARRFAAQAEEKMILK